MVIWLIVMVVSDPNMPTTYIRSPGLEACEEMADNYNDHAELKAWCVKEFDV